MFRMNRTLREFADPYVTELFSQYFLPCVSRTYPLQFGMIGNYLNAVCPVRSALPGVTRLVSQFSECFMVNPALSTILKICPIERDDQSKVSSPKAFGLENFLSRIIPLVPSDGISIQKLEISLNWLQSDLPLYGPLLGVLEQYGVRRKPRTVSHQAAEPTTLHTLVGAERGLLNVYFIDRDLCCVIPVAPSLSNSPPRGVPVYIWRRFVEQAQSDPLGFFAASHRGFPSDVELPIGDQQEVPTLLPSNESFSASSVELSEKGNRTIVSSRNFMGTENSEEFVGKLFLVNSKML